MRSINMHTPDHPGLKRRDFVKLTLAAGLAFTTAPRGWAADEKHGIPRRQLGKTGESVSLAGLGGYHIGMQRDEAESIRIIRAAIEGGINFMDNCWDYNEGASEIRMGKALQDGYRDRVFLMTKIDGRDKATAAKQIEESIRRLQVDHVDLMQFHEIIRMDDADRIFAEGGALEAMRAAQKAGKVRFIGFTGHKDPKIHLHMLNLAQKNGVHFDAVQLPLNVMDAHYDSFERKVLPVLRERGIGVLAMKPLGGGVILKSKTASPTECLHYAMNLPVDVVITGCESMENLEQALQATRTFQPMKKPDVEALLTKTAKAAKAGEFEKYKTSERFDATSRHPEWLG